HATPATASHIRRGGLAPGTLRTSCDSVRSRHAKAMFSTHSTAASNPGACDPHLVVSEPKSGPSTTPRLVAAESHPSPLARFFGSTLSATYAWITPVVPPPAPCTSRDTSSSQYVLE